ncbi:MULTISPECIES: ArsR/SmtB family transcription factor [Methanosarcina]|jgi:DNA-binding transcriptional ArsR family regulator|uniref:ArsR family transcriptional regulator n=1 Tax=Methanosarcina mazei TaxID=2209 RepID=A0A0F8ID32_METMZ|nr:MULTISPECIES: metalloregulator ArsR/SmtB family transcription factor [Methanosarcina]KKG05415.1 ArsR family transcriptional regulator [Methanosarcina mazei]KKG87637.1 ArsR family transcriptional regulator [Methanosarcina mazei]KKH79844.1 ArsR family transcriptional regulator [Methanosarcina mazei]
MQNKCKRVSTEQIKTLMQKVPNAEIITRMSAIFQALQSDTRLKILFLLRQKEMCVCELEEELEVTQSAVSHGLRTLRQLDLVRVRREGKFTVYYIADEHVRTLIEMCLEHVEEKA